MKRVTVIAVATVISASVARAAAPILSYGDFGVWSVGRTTSQDGDPSCFMQTGWADGRILTLHAFSSNLSFIQFDLFKPTWTIPHGTVTNIVMTLGTYTPSPMQAVGSGDTVTFGLQSGYIGQLEDEMVHSDSIHFDFPNGTEPTWLLIPDGAANAIPAFGKCVQNMPVAASPTQPFGSVTRRSKRSTL